jgi:hypothetical protein
MDWPLTGALAGVGVLVCAVGVGAVALVRSAPEPARKPAALVHLLPPIGGRTFITEGPATDAEPLPSPLPLVADPVAPKAKKSPLVPKPAPEAFGKALPMPEPKKMASANVPANIPAAVSANAPPASKPPAAEPQIEAERWRVTTTSKASYFNLGGHVDKAGIVDSLASSHLKEALRKNKNFDKLPPPLKAHISGPQNIDLNRIAPYRAMLGMDDSLMEAQGVRFERVARNH